MKYLVFDEMSKVDYEKARANVQVHADERKQGNLPTHVVPDHVLHGDLPQFTQNIRVFKIYETDDPKQLANIEALWTANDLPTWKRWIIPITALGDFSPAFEGYKKRMKV
jgi:hypothetical protein